MTLGKSISTIGKQAFYNCNLTSVTIPESVTTIGYNAFISVGRSLETVYFNAINCTTCGGAFSPIKTLIIGDNVKNIPDYAFRANKDRWYGNVESVVFGNSVTTIGTMAFYNSSLSSIVLPESVKTIKDRAFESSYALKSAIILGSVAEMGKDVFNDCTGMTRVAYPAHLSNPFPTNAYSFAYVPENVRYENGCLYDPDKTAILFGPWVEGEYRLPETITTIAENAFRGCSAMNSVTFRSSLRNIGKGAFTGCSGLTSLTSYVSPAPLFDISAFTDLYDIVAVNIPDNILGDYANGYSDWRLFKSLNALPSGSTEALDADLFAYRRVNGTDADVEIVASDKYASLTELVVPSTLQVKVEPTEPTTQENPEEEPEPQTITYNVVAIAPNAFANLENLTSATVSEGITRVGSAAFKGCKALTTVKFPSTVTEISSSTFQDCKKLETFTSDAEIIKVGAAAFAKTALSSVNMPSATIIGQYAYADNPAITRLAVSDAVESIGKGAFMNNGLTNVNLSSTGLLEIGDNAFASNTKLTEVTLGDGVTSVGDSAFAGCSKIAALKIGKDVATIGDNAFSGAPLTRSAAFVKDGALRHIGKYAFQNLRVRGELSLPDKVEYIGNGAFAYPRMLTKIVLPANRNLVVCDSAFTHAQRVTELVFPETIKSIGKHAFADLQAEGMTELNIKSHNIGEEAFATESTETHITKLSVAGNGTLGVRAFKGLTALTEASVEIPEISESAFADLNHLSNIHFGDNIERIAPSAFANCAIENLAFPTVENPAAVTVVEAGAFVGNPLKHLSLGNRMKQIDLLNINIGTYYTDQTVDLGSTVQRIERGAFKYLKSLTLPSSLEYISTEISTDSLNIPASSTQITIDTRVTVKHVYIDRKYSTRYSFASKFDLLANYGVYSLTCGETKDAGVIIYGFEDYIKDVHIGASVQSISTLRVIGKISFSEGIERIRSLDVSVRDTKTLKLPGSLKEITSLGIAGVETLIFGDSSEPLTLSSGAIRDYQNQSSAFKPKEVYIGRDITGTFTFTPFASTIEKAVIGDNVTTVNDGLFKDCASLTNVIMSDNVTTIGNEAFSGCSGLKVLSLSEKVTTIGDNAYSGCTNLERIVARGLTPAVGNAGFGTEVEDNVPIYVHDEVIDDYYDSDLFYPFNINPFSGNIVKEVTTENELTEEYEPGETFSIPESVSMIIDRYPEYVIDPEDPNEPVMSRSKVLRAAAAEETDLTKSFYYFSPDPDILTVDQTGTVTVRKEGEGRIWAYVLDGSDRKVEIGVNKFALEDFNHDGVIDSDDLQMLVNHIANPAESKIPSDKADLTKDGGVDSDDIQYHVNKIISK